MTKKKKQSIKSTLTLLSDSDTQSAVIGALKRTFSRSPTMRDFLRQYRREETWIKKDGTVAKKPKVFYPCFKCKKEFNSTSIQVDHIEPVIPTNIPAKHLSIDTLIQRLFCDKSNLQILCKEHHKEKSQQENRVRKEWISKTKFIVYETRNRVNNKRYIGVHKCDDYDDFYLGSGNLIKAALKKYGSDKFYRHILYVFDNANEAFLKEKELVSDEVVKSSDFYNIALGGSGNVIQNFNNEHLKTKVICHQTGQVYSSITEVANSLNISISSISKALDDPDQPVKNLHFFSLSVYDPKIQVTFPALGRRVVHLNTRNTYDSLLEAADSLKLNYKSLRNAMGNLTSDGVYALDDQYFLYEDEHNLEKTYFVNKYIVRCVELNKTFNDYTSAAKFIKHKNPTFGGIAIGKAVRNNSKSFKYHWVREVVSIQVTP